MNLYEAQDFIALTNPGKTIEYGFDTSCLQTYEINMIDASVDTPHFMQFNKLRSDVQGNAQPIYVPILPHREVKNWSEMKVILQELIDNN